MKLTFSNEFISRINMQNELYSDRTVLGDCLLEVMNDYPQLYIFLLDNQGEESMKSVMTLNGEYITSEMDINRPVGPDDVLHLSQDIPHGEGATTRLIIGVVLLIIAALLYWTPIGAPLSMYAVGLMIQTCVVVGVSMVMGAGAELLMTPPGSPQEADGLNGSPNYSFGGLKNTTASGTPMPIIYGTRRIGGHLLNVYTDVVSAATSDLLSDADKSTLSAADFNWMLKRATYLQAQIGLCEGEVADISNILINKKAATSFMEVRTNVTKKGTQSQSCLPGFNRIENVEAVGKIITFANPTATATKYVAAQDLVVYGYWKPSLYTLPDYKQTFVLVPLIGAFKSVNGEMVSTTEDDPAKIRLGWPSDDRYAQLYSYINVGGYCRKHVAAHIESTVLPSSVSSGTTYLTARPVQALKITVAAPAIYWQLDGTMYSTSVDITVAYRVAGSNSPYTVAYSQVPFSGASASEVDMVFAIGTTVPDGVTVPSGASAPLPLNYYEVLVYRHTGENPNETKIRNTVYLKDVSEIIFEELNYPHTALLGLTVRASDQINGSMPPITSLVKGMLISLPIGYNPVTRTYPGSFTGMTYNHDTDTGVKYHSDNPVWCLYDLLMNSRYGLKEYYKIDPNKVSLMQASFYMAAQYCDELVPNSAGGYSPRFKLDLIIDGSQAASEWISSIAVCMRSSVYYCEGMFLLDIDRPKPITQLFTMSNISDYSQGGPSIKNIPNVLEVQYPNPDLDYEIATIRIESPEYQADASQEERKQPLRLYGVTDIDQVTRIAKYILLAGKYLTKAVSFNTGSDGIRCMIGDRIGIQHDIPQWGYGGRTANYNSVAKTISLLDTFIEPYVAAVPYGKDALVVSGGYLYRSSQDVPSVTLISNATYWERLYSGGMAIMVSPSSSTTETETVTSLSFVSGVLTATLASALTVTVVDSDMFILGGVTDTVNSFKVMALVPNADKGTIEVSCVIYDAALYDQSDDLGGITPYIPPDYSMLPDTKKRSVSGLTVSARVYTDSSGAVKTGVDISYKVPTSSNWLSADLHYGPKGSGTFTTVSGGTPGSFFISDILVGGFYRFAITSNYTDGTKQSLTDALLDQTNHPYMDQMIVVYSSANGNIYSNITGLKINGNANSDQFTGKDCIVTWNRIDLSTYANDGIGNETKGAGGAGATNATLAGYIVEVLNVSDSSIRRSTKVTTETFTYTHEMNHEDGVSRNLIFRVKALDTTGNYSLPSLITAINPAPAALEPVTAVPYIGSVSLNWSTVKDLDLAGYTVHISNVSGFTPSADTLMYDGTGNSVYLTKMVGANWYVKAAAYDTFGQDSLNWSQEVVFEVFSSAHDMLVELNGAIKDDPLFTTLSTNVTKGVTETVDAINGAWSIKVGTDTKSYGIALGTVPAAGAVPAHSEMLVSANSFKVVNPDLPDEHKQVFTAGTVKNRAGTVISEVGIDGNLIVDGSITANAIQTDQLFVGSGGIRIDPSAVLTFGQVAKAVPTVDLSVKDALQQETEPYLPAPVYTRASTAYSEYDSVISAVDAPRIIKGSRIPGENSILMEPAATNWLAANLPSHFNLTAGFANASATISTITPNQKDPFGGTGAVRYVTAGGTSIRKFWIGGVVVPIGVNGCQQVWVRNRAATAISVSANIGTSHVDIPGNSEWTLVKHNSVLGVDGTSQMHLDFVTTLVGENIDVDLFRPMQDITATISCTSWTPSTKALDSLTVPVTSIGSSWSIECWAKSNAVGLINKWVFSSWPKFGVGIGGGSDVSKDGYPYFSYFDGTAIDVGVRQHVYASAALASPTGWNHWVATYDGTTVKVYVNGLVVISFATPLPKPWTNGSIQIGSNIYWLGEIAKFRVLDFVMTPLQADDAFVVPFTRLSYPGSTICALDFNTTSYWQQASTGMLKMYNGVRWVLASTVGAPTGTKVGDTFAETLEQHSAAAYTGVVDASDDNKLTGLEKQMLKKEWDVLFVEYPLILAQATSAPISLSAAVSPVLTYTTAYAALATYVSTLNLVAPWDTSTIVGATMRTNFKNYYDAKTALYNAVMAKAATVATWDGVAGAPGLDKILSNDAATTLGFNPSFEEWTTTLPKSWTSWGGNPGPTKETSPTYVRYGTNSAKFITNGVQDCGMFLSSMSTLPMPIGTFVAGTVDIYIGAVVSGTGKPGALIRLYTDTSLNNFTEVAVQPPTLTPGGWQKIPFSLRVGSAQQIYGIGVYIMGCWTGFTNPLRFNGTCYFDGFSFAFFDSSTDNTKVTLSNNGVLNNGVNTSQVTISGLGYYGDPYANQTYISAGKIYGMNVGLGGGTDVANDLLTASINSAGTMANWDYVTGRPNATKIDANGVYTGTVEVTNLRVGAGTNSNNTIGTIMLNNNAVTIPISVAANTAISPGNNGTYFVNSRTLSAGEVAYVEKMFIFVTFATGRGCSAWVEDPTGTRIGPKFYAGGSFSIFSTPGAVTLSVSCVPVAGTYTVRMERDAYGTGSDYSCTAEMLFLGCRR
jgi:hypothetical protein